MQSKASTPEQYLNQLPQERKQVMTKLRDIILKNLPKGFEECITTVCWVMLYLTACIQTGIM